MGIQIEFNPDLALRAFETKGRLPEECLPERLKEGEAYKFLKEGQRNYWFDGEIPLLITTGNANLSRPLASIIILNANHHKRDGKMYTEGSYLVKKVFDINNPTIHFEGMNKIKGEK